LPDAIGRAWEGSVDPEDRERVTDGWFRVIAEKESFGPSVSRIKHKKTGEVTWVVAEASPVRDSKHSLVGYVGSIELISEEDEI
jgi:PAS domain S-box-containing protein